MNIDQKAVNEFLDNLKNDGMTNPYSARSMIEKEFYCDAGTAQRCIDSWINADSESGADDIDETQEVDRVDETE